MKVTLTFLVLAAAVATTAASSSDIVKVTACVNSMWNNCQKNCTTFYVNPDTCLGTNGYGSLDFRCYPNETYNTIDTILFEGPECSSHAVTGGGRVLKCGACTDKLIPKQTYTCGKDKVTVMNCKGHCNATTGKATDCSIFASAPYGSCTPLHITGSRFQYSFLVAPNFNTVVPIRFQNHIVSNNCTSSGVPWNSYNPGLCFTSFPTGSSDTMYNFQLECVSNHTTTAEQEVKDGGDVVRGLPGDMATHLRKALAAAAAKPKKPDDDVQRMFHFRS